MQSVYFYYLLSESSGLSRYKDLCRVRALTIQQALNLTWKVVYI
jgi:hypothetical protein